MILFPNCKINLGLQVVRKRADGYHDLETVFYPVPLHDALEVVQLSGKGEIGFTASGRNVTAAPEQNLCYKAYQLLKDRFPDLPSVAMHLHKVLPSGAGLGGGSADGAFALRLLNDKLNLGLPNRELSMLALQLGSDCPFFIYNKPCLARGRGEELEPLALDLAGYWLQIVHTGIHIPTADAFRSVRPDDSRPSLREVIVAPVATWRDRLYNDFEDSVFPLHPSLAKTKQDFYDSGALYASMTGSGSAVYGIFPKDHKPGWISYPTPFFVRWLQLGQ